MSFGRKESVREIRGEPDMRKIYMLTTPSAGAFFTTYEHTKSLFTRLNTNTRNEAILPIAFVHASASSLAELVSCAILTPAEVIKQNAQMVSSTSQSQNATLQTLAKFQSNPLALWRGYTALAGRNLPFTAMQFPMFERLKEGIKKYRDDRGLTKGGIFEMGWITALSAGSAGAVSAVLTTPVDVIKTRVMLAAAEGPGDEGKGKKGGNGGKGLVDALGKEAAGTKDTVKNAAKDAADSLNPMKASPSQSRGRKSSWAVGKEIVEEKGFKGLWRGGALRGVWTFIGAGLYLGAYESGRVWLAGRRGESVDEDDLL
ncbi:uncharacterized protein J4E79_010644 [Alternaria viburni]|uniref:uncharacterized protein n=1 Tax=Alternaria viburni TaxID=566460 RepID=UPI0020C284CD|nr:uncharacterized protein J4E79_010644 [Alternaria viburni]KAI4646135.1 hypothetical protein J4E79_010644 [Alternaria viburni]